MRHIIYIFLLLSINYSGLSQCAARFDVSGSGATFQFDNMSIIPAGDTLNALVWRFGDGSTSLTDSPTHTYNGPSLYKVVLEITTNQGCTDRDSAYIEVCDLDLDFNLSEVCDANEELALLLDITDIFGVLEEVDIYLDDQLVSDTAIAIPGGSLSYGLKVPGDGNQHFVRVDSRPNGFCSETIGFIVQDCNVSCFLSSLDIDDGYTELHAIAVTSSGYAPSNRVIDLGDRVRFLWLDDMHSSTSEDTLSVDRWDSGVQDSSFVFDITPKNPGIKPFFSTADGGEEGDYRGNIIANCPDSRGSVIGISFVNAAVPNDGFYIGIDGVTIKDTVYQYSLLGLTDIEFFLPGDGKAHQISVIDIEDPTCTLKKTIRAINCEGFFDCSINVDASIIERCDEDSLVTVGIDIGSLRPTSNGILLMLDDTITLDTVFFSNTQATTMISLFGDGLLHTITAMDLTDTVCTDEVILLINDCSAPCSIDNLEIGTGSNSTVVLAVGNESISLQDLAISSGDDILWQWFQDSLVGVRSVEDAGADAWDSGLQSDGAIFLSPILTAGIHPYFLYNAADEVLFTASIEVVASCDENQIPIFYNFTDVNGSTDGYDIYVDNIRREGGPYPYALDGNNRGAFQIEGDDMEHLIEIRDVSEAGCTNGSNFVAPTCEIPPCGGLIEIQIQDSCYNDNTVNFLVTVSHPEPNPQGFILRLDGALYGGLPYFYGSNGETQFNGRLQADSSAYTFTYMDLADNMCVDTLIYESPLCVTDCALRHIRTDVVDSAYQVLFPMTPDSLVGCRDSFIHVAIEFVETYSDADSFFVVVDSVMLSDTYAYLIGDGRNTAYIPVIGDDQEHEIILVDAADSNCQIVTHITTPRCFSPCNLVIDDLLIDSCVMQIASYTLVLDTSTNSIGYQTYVDGDTLAPSMDSIVNFTTSGDGLSHMILLIDDMEPLCRDSIEFTAPYCLVCDLDVSVIQRDSCEIGDSIGYSFQFDPSIDTLGVLITTADSTFVIQPSETGFLYDIRLRGDSTIHTFYFESVSDQFCNQTISIQTTDCTPIICEPDFDFVINGLTISFTDQSTSSEPIIDQFWTISELIEVGNLSTFNYTVDSIGLYEVCHTITTDSCTAEICKDILVGDPCTFVVPSFTFEKVSAGFQFTNTSIGNIDEYLYRFGDGIFSNTENPFHVYASPGTYEVCLIVKQDQFSCEKTFCDSLDVLVAVNDVVDQNQKLTIYPNPIQHSNQVLQFIYEGSTLASGNIRILDIAGRLIEVGALKSADGGRYQVLMPSNLASGIYYLSVIENGSIISQRFVVI